MITRPTVRSRQTGVSCTAAMIGLVVLYHRSVGAFGGMCIAVTVRCMRLQYHDGENNLLSYLLERNVEHVSAVTYIVVSSYCRIVSYRCAALLHM
jgi:hypothetical protein